MMLVCALAVLAEDVTFMTNRRQWEKLPTATLMQMGSIFMNHKVMPDSGMLCYTIVSNRYAPDMTDEDIQHCIHATCNIGRIYTEFYHDFSKAYDYLLNAQEMAEQHHQNDYKAIIHIGKGVDAMRQGKPEEALEVFKNSTIDDSNPSNTAELKIMRNNCIYYALEHLGRYDEALKTLIHNKDFTQKEAPYYIHECYKLLADFYNKQKNQPLAEKYELLYYRAINNLNTTTLSHAPLISRQHDVCKHKKALLISQNFYNVHLTPRVWVF